MVKYNACVKMMVWANVYDIEADDVNEAEGIAEALAEKYIDDATSQGIPSLSVEVVGFEAVGENEITTSNDD